MKTHCIAICFAILLTGCGRDAPPVVTALPDSFSRSWVSTGQMDGYMGVALALTADRYYYWFYSDVVTDDTPTYPITGTFTFDGTRLHLDGDALLYSHNWVITTNQSGVAFLISQDERTSLRLAPLPNFDPLHPFEWKTEKKQNKVLEATSL